MNRPLLLLLACVVSLDAMAAKRETAMELLARGDATGARQEYERMLEARPRESRLSFNAALAAYAQGDWEGAARHFESALGSADIGLQRRAFLGLGNTRFRQGEGSEEHSDRVRFWEEAARQYEAATGLDPSDTEAAGNLELVREMLANLPKPPEDQKQQKKQPSKDKKQDKDKDKKEQEDQQDPGDKSQDPGQDQQQSKDRSGKDQKDGEQPKDGESSKEDSSEQGQQGQGEKSGDEKSDQAKGGKGDGKKEPGEAGGEESEGEGREGEPGKGGGRSAQPGEPNGEDSEEGQMAVRFAERLLDSHKREEKALIWRPVQAQPKERSSNNRRKTW